MLETACYMLCGDLVVTTVMLLLCPVCVLTALPYGAITARNSAQCFFTANTRFMVAPLCQSSRNTQRLHMSLCPCPRWPIWEAEMSYPVQVDLKMLTNKSAFCQGRLIMRGAMSRWWQWAQSLVTVSVTADQYIIHNEEVWLLTSNANVLESSFFFSSFFF